MMLRITQVRLAVLAPVVLVLCVIGAYAVNNTMNNVYVLLIFGVLGYALVKARFPLAPLILGLILGDQIELNLVRALMTDDNPFLFFTRPISGALMLMAALCAGFAAWQHLRYQSRRNKVKDESDV
jgi:putative tricarboxylic transport membrane protein